MSVYDAVVVGAGPNGLAAAITLARNNQKVLVLEAADTIGGGTRTKELTLPGFQHDVCSAIHPLGLGSPFFQSLPLTKYGLEWIQPRYSVAHPLDDGTAAHLEHSIQASAESTDRDAKAYAFLMSPFAKNWHKLAHEFLGPLRFPRYPFTMAHFGVNALLSAKLLTKIYFRGQHAPALFGGLAAHSFLAMEQVPSAAFGLVLGALAHAVGWAIPKGGSQAITQAMADYLSDLGGEIITNQTVKSLAQLPPAKAVLLDLTPRQILKIGADKLPDNYLRKLEKYRYGNGVFKLDIALDGTIPWQAEACNHAGTVHLGGTFEEVAGSERAVIQGSHPAKPFVLLAQQSLFDDSRAPAGKHTVWAYCHVPAGSTVDMTAQIESQIERFAPGFKQKILARHTMNCAAMEQYNPNYVGGDINGGVQDLGQLFSRPTLRLNPYTTPLKGLYICSSATPPGGGVHGMCGYFAAKTIKSRHPQSK
jgi:phytoene dehydrogenase-like protein